jgi:hypothetical protein
LLGMGYSECLHCSALNKHGYGAEEEDKEPYPAINALLVAARYAELQPHPFPSPPRGGALPEARVELSCWLTGVCRRKRTCTTGKAKDEPCKGVPLIFDYRNCFLSQPVPKARVGVGSRSSYSSNGDI